MSSARPEQVRKDLGRRVAEIRRGRGLTQAQLAEVVDLTTNYIARIETGRENLTLDSVTRLANILCVQVRELFIEPEDRKVRRGRPAGLRAEAPDARRRRRNRGKSEI